MRPYSKYMPIKTRLTTQGFSEYLERVANAGLAIDQISANALAAGGEVLLDGMKQRVPKDTKNLERHLTVEGPYKDGNFVYIEVGLPKTTDANTARYGNVQEFGSSNMKAQPFVRPTLDHDMAKARKAMREVFERELQGL
jgi:HK97 gp10 family phage protein